MSGISYVGGQALNRAFSSWHVAASCVLCPLELYAIKYEIAKEAASRIIGIHAFGAAVSCTVCFQEVGGAAFEALGSWSTKCCIGEWYDCNCRCINIRW
jgi:hypothetical protein